MTGFGRKKRKEKEEEIKFSSNLKWHNQNLDTIHIPKTSECFCLESMNILGATHS